jgi:hypothetical protein
LKCDRRRGFGLLEISTFFWPNPPKELEKLKTRNCRVLSYQRGTNKDFPRLCKLPSAYNQSYCDCHDAEAASETDSKVVETLVPWEFQSVEPGTLYTLFPGLVEKK